MRIKNGLIHGLSKQDLKHGALENPNLKQSVRFGIVLEAGGQDGALLFRQDSSAAVGAALPRPPAPARVGVPPSPQLPRQQR